MTRPLEIRPLRKNKFLYLAFIGLITACASHPTKPAIRTSENGGLEGQWHGKILLTDKKTDKSHTLVIDVSARESAAHVPTQMRLEAETQLGIYVASIAVNGEQLAVLLPRQKRFVQAPATIDSMAHFLNVPIDPKVFVSLLFDQAPVGTGWICTGTSAPTSCQNESQDLHITWDQRTAERRLLHLVSNRADARLSLENVSTKVEFRPDLFDLQPPKGYKVEKIAP